MNAVFSVNRGVTLLMIIREMETFDFGWSLRVTHSGGGVRVVLCDILGTRFYRAKWFPVESIPVSLDVNPR